MLTFPVIFHPFGYALHAHVLFETLAYTAGFQTFLLLRRRRASANADAEAMLWMIAGAVVGALVGSKVLAWAESWPDYWKQYQERRDALNVWLGGKTIVGGLLGGWAGVEVAKKCLGIRARTGDAYVVPLCVAIAIGRVGCFLTGLPDHTYGTPTRLPWAVDFGDGVPRHPTQLYESAFALLLAIIFAARGIGWRHDTRGRGFRAFLLAYLLFRCAIEFIKPSWKPYAGLSAIQIASTLGALICVAQLIRRDAATPPRSRGVPRLLRSGDARRGLM